MFWGREKILIGEDGHDEHEHEHEKNTNVDLMGGSL